MRHYWRVLCLTAIMLCIGCHSSSTTVGIQGEVSFDGRAVEKGTIDFVPVDGTGSWSAAAMIVNGRYEIPAKRGLLADGTYQVRIIGMKKTGKTAAVPHRLQGMGLPQVESEENYIPPLYNISSTLKVRVSDVPDKNKVDFHLGHTPAGSKY